MSQTLPEIQDRSHAATAKAIEAKKEKDGHAIFAAASLTRGADLTTLSAWRVSVMAIVTEKVKTHVENFKKIKKNPNFVPEIVPRHIQFLVIVRKEAATLRTMEQQPITPKGEDRDTKFVVSRLTPKKAIQKMVQWEVFTFPDSASFYNPVVENYIQDELVLRLGFSPYIAQVEIGFTDGKVKISEMVSFADYKTHYMGNMVDPTDLKEPEGPSLSQVFQMREAFAAPDWVAKLKKMLLG